MAKDEARKKSRANFPVGVSLRPPAPWKRPGRLPSIRRSLLETQEAAMSLKKIALAAVICYVVLMATNWLIHDVWLMKDYLASQESYRPISQMMHKIWVMWIGQALFAAMFCWIYARGAEAKPWVAQGIRYGIVMTLFTVIPYSMGEYVVYNIPHTIVEKWMMAGCAQLIILGLIVAGICQKQTA
jgi:hypothetical protein